MKKHFQPFRLLLNDIKKKMECKIVGCKTKVMGLTWTSDFISLLYIKAGHASPQCSKTFLISKKGKIGPHNSLTTSLKIQFTTGSLQRCGPTAFYFQVSTCRSRQSPYKLCKYQCCIPQRTFKHHP
jgi:hypothetical protein